MTDETRSSIVRRVFNTSFPTWWNRENNTNDFLYALSNEYFKLYSNASKMHTAVNINTSTGDDLNDFGKLFKLAREVGESDEIFRAKIKGFWAAMTGGGTVEGIKSVVNLFTGIDKNLITITEGDLRIDIAIEIDEDFDLTLLDSISDVVNRAKAAGIYYDETIIATSANGVFRCNLSYTNGEDTII